MVRTTLAVLGLVIAAGAASPHADERSDARAQLDFGIEVARRGLWKEAVFRWERAVDLDPTYAEAWNNLAIGFEQQGLMDEAREAYETALDLAPNNVAIEQNYDLFLEVNDRVTQSSR